MQEILETLGRLGLVPVVKIEKAGDAVELGRALLAGGLPCAEITFRTEAAEEAIRRISSSLPEIALGAGTVLSVDQADRAVAAGAQFIVSPGFNRKVVDWCLGNGVAVTPGVATPTEIDMALDAGLGRLEIEAGAAPCIDPSRLAGRPVAVRFRAGGEALAPIGSAHRRSLKKLFQEAGIPPWWRDRVPLVFAQEEEPTPSPTPKPTPKPTPWPTPEGIKGLDVSHWNGYPNFTKLHNQGMRFVFSKATQGTTIKDATFKQHTKDARAAGLLAGAYHFFDYRKGGKAQANHFLDTVRSTTGLSSLLPLVVAIAGRMALRISWSGLALSSLRKYAISSRIAATTV